MKQRIMISTIVPGLCCALAACGEMKDRSTLPVAWEQKGGFIDQEQSGDFTVIVECPTERGGNGQLHVYQSEVKSAFHSEATRLDVAVTKNGFEAGEFVTITPIEAGEKAVMNAQGGAQAITPRTELLTSLHLEAQPKYFEEESTADWTVQGLVPGVNYYVRLSTLADGDQWKADRVVRVQGPICPEDEQEEKR